MRQYETIDGRTNEAPPPRTASPEIGDRITFTPSAFISIGGGPKYTPDGMVPVKVTGTIVEVHEAHRWYRCEYDCLGVILNECFKY